MILDKDIQEILDHAEASQRRYGNFASAHEALGVALEEWNELQAAIQSNEIQSIRDEAIDLAAVCMRLAEHCRSSVTFQKRSGK